MNSEVKVEKTTMVTLTDEELGQLRAQLIRARNAMGVTAPRGAVDELFRVDAAREMEDF